ncbi:uncharacterized protein A4U43_C05F450 [Asparagus officinalis]|uniref:Uncharacterized protein n=1 Tax=Asparagus officinalis TaxID=4686 RepID=A0A5P1ENG6_ASPOF|nr:uncharacterized protein A4U43_C05F450 [Asparagus officinalis]
MGLAAEGLWAGVFSEEIIGTFIPIGIYWLYSGLYCLLNDLDRYRMHSRKDEESMNSISKATVVRGVLFQQSVQAAVSILLFAVAGHNEDSPPPQVSSVLVYILATPLKCILLDLDKYMYSNVECGKLTFEQ